MAEWGVTFGKPRFDIDAVRARRKRCSTTLTGGLAQLANAPQRQGRPRPRHVRRLPNAAARRAAPSHLRERADHVRHCILASGSRAPIPAFQIKSPRVMDSTGRWTCRSDPRVAPRRRRRLHRPRNGHRLRRAWAAASPSSNSPTACLPGADRDLVKPAAQTARNALRGDHASTPRSSRSKSVGDRVEGARRGREGKKVHAVRPRAVSIGRRPVTNGIGLENTKVTITERGFIEVDEQQANR